MGGHWKVDGGLLCRPTCGSAARVAASVPRAGRTSSYVGRVYFTGNGPVVSTGPGPALSRSTVSAPSEVGTEQAPLDGAENWLVKWKEN